jgi:hypothetical protein
MWTTYYGNMTRNSDESGTTPTPISLPLVPLTHEEVQNISTMEIASSAADVGPPGLTLDSSGKLTADVDHNKVVWEDGDAENPQNWCVKINRCLYSYIGCS